MRFDSESYLILESGWPNRLGRLINFFVSGALQLEVTQLVESTLPADDWQILRAFSSPFQSLSLSSKHHLFLRVKNVEVSEPRLWVIKGNLQFASIIQNRLAYKELLPLFYVLVKCGSLKKLSWLPAVTALVERCCVGELKLKLELELKGQGQGRNYLKGQGRGQ